MSLSFSFWIGQSTVSSTIKETCEFIWDVLKKTHVKTHVKTPSCAADWVGISRGFEQLWNFPNCIGISLCRTSLLNVKILSNNLIM